MYYISLCRKSYKPIKVLWNPTMLLMSFKAGHESLICDDFSFRDGSEVMTCVSDGVAIAISRGTKLLRWHIPLSSVAY